MVRVHPDRPARSPGEQESSDGNLNRKNISRWEDGKERSLKTARGEDGQMKLDNRIGKRKKFKYLDLNELKETNR